MIEIRTVTIKRGEDKSNDVLAIMCGDHLCAHEAVDDLAMWTVTHVPTGRRVCFASDVFSAIEAAQKVMPLADWSFTDPANAKQIPNDVKAQMHAVFKAAGDPREFLSDAKVPA